MKKVFLLLTVFVSLLALSSEALASGDVCFEGERMFTAMEGFEAPGELPFLMTQKGGGLQCRDIKPYILGLDAATYTMTIIGGGMACMGMPTSVGFYSAGLVIATLNFVVKNIPCEPDVPEEAIERIVEEKICDYLWDNGYDCTGKKQH